MIVEPQHGLREVSVSNAGVSGSATNDWQPGSGNYSAAKSAFQAAGVTHISVMLGTNDARSDHLNSQATYQAQLSAIVTQLLSDFPGVPIILHAPPFAGLTTLGSTSWTEQSQGLILSYRQAIASIAATHTGTVYTGDTTAYGYFSEHPEEINGDRIHPLRQGVISLGSLWAEAFYAGIVAPRQGAAARRLGAVRRSIAQSGL